MNDQPLVTCICLTRNRREWLPSAIDCFRSQSYANRELLIVLDGDDDYSDIVPAEPMIRLIKLAAPLTIGLKRNVACKEAKGEIICHWDDDDYSASGRLAEQVSMLMDGKSVAAYSTLIFKGETGTYRYAGIPNCTGIGTSLCYLKTWWESHPFPDKHVGEDGDFAMDAAREKQLISRDGGEMIIASIHPGNTSPRHVEGAQWRKL